MCDYVSLGLFSGQNGCGARGRQQELGELLVMAQMLPIYARLSLDGQMVLLLILGSGGSGGVMHCLTCTWHSSFLYSIVIFIAFHF